ncbi:hypothetical protein DFAR_200040 [Desulfarculales bacterium]
MAARAADSACLPVSGDAVALSAPPRVGAVAAGAAARGALPCIQSNEQPQSTNADLRKSKNGFIFLIPQVGGVSEARRRVVILLSKYTIKCIFVKCPVASRLDRRTAQKVHNKGTRREKIPTPGWPD